MRLEVLIIVIFLLLKINLIQCLKLRTGYDNYSDSADTDPRSSNIKDSESEYTSGKYSSEVVNGPKYSTKSAKTDYASQVESEDGDDDEPEKAPLKVQSEKAYSEKNDDYSNEESSEVEIPKRSSKSTENGQGEVNMPQIQYMARQQRFNLASTVNPPSDVSNINYVFLSPAAQRQIDRKISRLQRGGRYHGSMKETKTVGEWQKRYYSRPATEYGEVKASNQGTSSIFTWIILGFIVILIVVICTCGVCFLSKE
ncbi:uncharacterized protein cubi_02399 [Cryptosporidium ubiquitum]|uniref:Uncharacterized protein n=1 Tax=Cryptosporidium ubiquitum TaxID=857276 RepID=A0A1J4MGP1_9CRYT|nr:uncharacterized protein cubi_02399 [Cryptosporidium ubiquitum]OII73167.1 hypothetical protein cubi_02399 [Cryptosporidium ubiquitum]